MSERKRVVIFGAGASRFAGFPLGGSLWSFLVDHEGVKSSGMEWIDAHLASLPKAERARTVADLEFLLTSYEMGFLPKVAGLRNRQEPRPTTFDEDKQAFLESHRHQWANRKGWNTDGYYDARVIRRSSGAVMWGPMALRSLVGTIVTAFLHHHSCVLHGGNHDCAVPLPHRRRFRKGQCPCYPQFSARRHRKTLEALARGFDSGDTIITFNWDVLIESVLWKAGKWNPLDGYGFPIAIHDDRRRAFGRSAALKRLSRVKVLKGHGSINWVRNHEDDTVGLNNLGLLFGMPIYSTYLPDIENSRKAHLWSEVTTRC